jgi:hypothetical protein
VREIVEELRLCADAEQRMRPQVRAVACHADEPIASRLARSRTLSRFTATDILGIVAAAARTPRMTTFRKPVSTMEKLYVVFDRLRPPFANQFVVEGRGRIDHGALRDAVARAADANPGCRLRMTGHLAARAWVLGPAPRVTVVTGSTWDGRSEHGAPFLDARLDVDGPTCEVQLIEARDRTFLVFRSLHAVMDGLGTLLWAHDVFRALRGETPVGHPSALTDSDLAAGVRDEPLVLPPSDALSATGRADAVTSGNDFRWRRVTIDEPADVSVVAAMAVTIAAEARRHGEGTVRFNVPADLRGLRKDERTTGNAVGTLFVEVAADATVASVADEIRGRLRARDHARFPASYERLRWLPLGALHAMIARGFANEHARGRYAFTATISFLGTVDAAAIAAPGFAPANAFWIPPMADQGCFVACARFGGRLDVMLSMPRVLASGGRFEALHERLVVALGGGAASLTA